MMDLRLPIGIFFTIVGAMLFIDGIIQHVMVDNLNIPINTEWGLFLFVFGVVMTIFGLIASRKNP